MPSIQVGDISMNYTVQGQGDWLVMVGGYASGNWSSWGPQLDMAAQQFKVLAFDNRGIGGTDAPDVPYTTQMLARDALGLMQALGISRAHVMGKSLGGAIAQWMAILQPESVFPTSNQQLDNPKLTDHWPPIFAPAIFGKLIGPRICLRS